ncbi:MAG: ABC transporter substrate-binding protein [Rubellimicrobium sp.]|nr:ABC transporter substrate-binding protein [Rubellimicrobium sp.]
MRRAVRLALGAMAAALGVLAVPAVAAPARVVSINLCTDQLAMLLAAPGQLVSVSRLASDPLSSSMADEAAAYPANRGSAEQVYLMHPDLVLAGEYTDHATVDLLRRLGVQVVQVPIVNALDEVPGQLRLVAAALGREAEGEALVARYERDLAALTLDVPELAGALYYPNGYTTGGGTVADDVLTRAGFFNVAVDAGVTGGGILPLENLVLAHPRLVVTSRPYPGASRSEDILRHPALAALGAEARVVAANDADWLCGTPHILRALAAMRELRLALQ